MIRPITALLALLLTVSVVNLGAVESAHATAEPQGVVQVEIAGLLPLAPKPGERLEVTGVLRNVAEVPLRDVGLRMLVGAYPLSSAEEAVWTAVDQPAIGGDLAIQRPGFVSLAPGGQSSFSLSVPFDQLNFDTPGVYPLTVESVDGRGYILGHTNTMVAWFPPDSVPTPAKLTFLWPLMGVPARDAENVFLTSSVAGEVASDGRLRDLLGAGARFPSALSWVIDPQTVQGVELLARPHVELTGDGVAVELPADPDATAWLDKLRTGLASATRTDVTAAAYADPDTPAEVGAGLLGDLVLATTTAPEMVSTQLNRAVQAGFSWPPLGRIDQATLNALRLAGVRNVALAADGVVTEAQTPVVSLSTDSGPITAVLGDAELTVALRLLADPSANPIVARQLFFALVALDAQFLDTPTVVAMPPSTRWSVDRATAEDLLTGLTTGGYATFVPLRDVLADDASKPAGELAPFGPLAESALLPSEHLQIIADAGATLTEIGEIAVQPGEALSPYREALLRSASTAWRSEPDLGALQLRRTADQISAQRDKVAISSAGPVAFPGEQGRVPVTVSNDLPVAVTVGLTLSATPSYRIEPQPIARVTVPPGQRLSLEVPVRVIGSEPLTVTAQLLTGDGMPYGPGEPFELRTSAYSRVAAWAVGLAFGVLIILAGWSTVRRYRSRRIPTTGATDDEVEAAPVEGARVERE